MSRTTFRHDANNPLTYIYAYVVSCRSQSVNFFYEQKTNRQIMIHIHRIPHRKTTSREKRREFFFLFYYCKEKKTKD